MVQSISTAQHSTAQHSTADYVIRRVFYQALKQTFSHFCGEVFSGALKREVA